MAHRHRVQLYSTFLRLTGDLVGPPDVRVTDLVDGCDRIELRDARVEPATEGGQELGRSPQQVTVVTSGITLLCPLDQVGETARHREAWREKRREDVLVNTQSFSMVCEVHLEPGVDLAEHLLGDPRTFVPVTNLTALWLAGGEPRPVQRSFALLNRGAVVSFSPAPPPGRPAPLGAAGV